MVNIAIFASGNGSNFENIVQEINNGHVNNAVCKVLIIDKEQAYAKERAAKLQIPCVFVDPKAYAGKEPYEQEILNVLKEQQVELIVLAGYMRFIGRVLLESYPRRIINLHPAYLPHFPGAHSIQDAYEAKVDFTGVTVHFEMKVWIQVKSSIRRKLKLIPPGHWKPWKSMYMRWSMTCFQR